MVRIAAAALILLTACGADGPSAETIAAERAAVAADAAAKSTDRAAAGIGRGSAAAPPAVAATVQSGRIDPEPNAGRSRFSTATTRRNDGREICVITIAYAGAVEQEVAWGYGACAEAGVRLLSVATLREMGQLDDLDPEARRDIERSAGGTVLYAEGEFTSSAFPLNVAGNAYEVSLSD